MPYCPQCGREQRCGCTECHSCGVPLIDRQQNSALPPPPRATSPIRRQEHGSVGRTLLLGEAEDDEPGRVNWLAHVFLILGVGILFISVIEIANLARHFPAMGSFETASEGLRRAGYYSGILLYTNSVRLMTGFALLAGGVLTGRAAHPDNWDTAVRATGLVMGGLSIAYFITCVLLILPVGSTPYELRVLLPPLWAAVPVLFVTGGALLGAGFLMASRLSRQRESLSSRFSRKGKASKKAAGSPTGLPGAGAGTGPAPVKSYGAEREGGVTD
jgi:hypothetical protein